MQTLLSASPVSLQKKEDLGFVVAVGLFLKDKDTIAVMTEVRSINQVYFL